MNTSTLSPLAVAELWIAAMDPTRMYSLKEESLSGDMLTHSASADCEYFTHEELSVYVPRIWVASHPPELVICPVS
jgi:hypothetical protein